MPLSVPNLDDRSFEQLVAEGRALIPRYSRDWTNHNPSDPGITLLEVFAWFTETANYRLNRLPAAAVARFLRLLGTCPKEDETIDLALGRALATLERPERAVTSQDFTTLALRLAEAQAAPVVAEAGEATVLTRGVAGGTTAPGTLEVRRPVFRVGDRIRVGRSTEAVTTTVTSVSGTVLTVEPFDAEAPVDLLEAPARAELQLFQDRACGPPGRPDAAPPVALVIVVPDRPEDPAPAPTLALTRALYRSLTTRRLVTSRVHVAGPVYVPVSVGLTVVATPAGGLREVDVEEAVRRFLSPLRGGPEGRGWVFGRAVYASEVFQRVETTAGVDHVERLDLATEPPGRKTAEGIELPLGGLVAAREVRVVVVEQ